VRLEVVVMNEEVGEECPEEDVRSWERDGSVAVAALEAEVDAALEAEVDAA
jgi:hypothetical protein